MADLKKVLCTGLALVVSICTVLPLYARADKLEETSEILVSASEEAPFSLYQAARPDSEVTVLTEEAQLQIGEAGEVFSLIHIEFEDGDIISGYVQTAFLNEYRSIEEDAGGSELEDAVAAERELPEEAGADTDQLYLTVPEDGITLLSEAFQNSDPVFTILQPVTATVEAEYQYVEVEYEAAEAAADMVVVEFGQNDEEAEAEEAALIYYAEYEALCEYLPEAEEAAEETEETPEAAVVQPEEILEAENAAPASSAAATAAGTMPAPIVLDISHHQGGLTSSQYDKLASQIGLVIIRVSDGTSLDTEYKTHITEFQKRGVPIHVYMYMRKAYSMETYMKFLYDNAKAYDPIMYWLDFELSTFTSSDVSEAVKQLRSRVGDAKVGIYVAHHLYTQINPKVSEVDAVWIPRYGNNNGYYDSKYDPNYSCDIHQYTDKGRLTGYNYDLDLSRLTLTNSKDLSYFSTKLGTTSSTSSGYYTSNPGTVTMLKTDHIYSSTTFKDSTKTGNKLVKGTNVKVNGIAYSSGGTPRLKVDGGYITANLEKVGKYYTSNPGTVTMLKTDHIYSSTTFKESTKTGKKVSKGASVTVTGIAYNSSGVPRLKVSGGYITANSAYVSKYHTTNPGTVKMLKKDHIYSSTTFSASKKTGKTVAKGSKVTVLGIAYSSGGTPRLKVNGGYITANSANVSK